MNKRDISRWYILSLSSFIIFGVYFAYDVPAALNLELHEYLGYDNENFQYYIQVLYSVYSIPNLFLPLLGGLLVDRWGNRVLLLITAFAVTVGQGIFTLGLFLKSARLAYIGRFVLGVGGESLGVVQSTISYNWFADKELGLAIGINVLVGRIGSVLNDIITPWLGAIGGVTIASTIGTLICFMSLFCSIILSRIERFFPLSSTSSSSQAVDSPKKEHTFSLRAFTSGFWLLCLLIILIEGPMVPFNNIHAELLSSRFFKEGEHTLAAQIMFLPDTLSAILIPPLGAVVDRFGMRARFLIFCASSLAFIHLVLMTTPTTSNVSSFHVYPLLFLLGIAYAIAVILYTCIPLVIADPSQAGTAFGISTTAWNIASFIYPLIVAELASKDPNFISSEFFFLLNSCVAILVLVYLELWDERWNERRLANPQKHLKRTDSNDTYHYVADSDGVEIEDLELDELNLK